MDLPLPLYLLVFASASLHSTLTLTFLALTLRCNSTEPLWAAGCKVGTRHISERNTRVGDATCRKKAFKNPYCEEGKRRQSRARLRIARQ
jgi:hypothetical protein